MRKREKENNYKKEFLKTIQCNEVFRVSTNVPHI